MNLGILEKKALLGLLGVILFFTGSIVIIGNRNLWFETKNTYKTQVKDADGLRIGSQVVLYGLKVGEVISLIVDENNRIEVSFSVVKSLAGKLRQTLSIELDHSVGPGHSVYSGLCPHRMGGPPRQAGEYE